jgi:hypothetical protein
VKAQGHARTQYRRAIEHKNLMGADMALREMGAINLLEALDYVALPAELRPAKAPRAAVRWHGRLETETPILTLPESMLALAALIALCQGDREALRRLRGGCGPQSYGDPGTAGERTAGPGTRAGR